MYTCILCAVDPTKDAAGMRKEVQHSKEETAVTDDGIELQEIHSGDDLLTTASASTYGVAV